MNIQEFDPDRERFISLYATKLKELRRTPFAQRDIRELERLAERFLVAVQNATRGSAPSPARLARREWSSASFALQGRSIFGAVSFTA